MPRRTVSPVAVGTHVASSPPTTARSPFVTLQPTPVGDHLNASDPSDFYGLGAAVLAIVVIVVLAKLIFRGRARPERRERAD